MTLEDRIALLDERTTTILHELRELRREHTHEAGRWATRAEGASHYGVSVDTIDARIADGSILSKKLGPSSKKEKRDKLGRRIDRRRVLVWVEGAPKVSVE